MREADYYINGRNQSLYKNSKTGVAGVNWNKFARKWHSRIKFDGKTIHLGTYHDFDEAVSVRRAKESELGFHPNHGARKIEQVNV